MAKRSAGKKNKWLAALLNFVILGLGYIYVGKGKRLPFAVALVILEVLVGIWIGFNISPNSPEFLYFLALGLIFAWDAYKDAEELT